VPTKVLNNYEMALEVFEKMDEPKENLAAVIKTSRDLLAALIERKGPEEVKEGLETAQRFFRAFWIVSLEHLVASSFISPVILR
jgi:hypothetical protein